jgi:hypothetical protein
MGECSHSLYDQIEGIGQKINQFINYVYNTQS